MNTAQPQPNYTDFDAFLMLALAMDIHGTGKAVRDTVYRIIHRCSDGTKERILAPVLASDDPVGKVKAALAAWQPSGVYEQV